MKQNIYIIYHSQKLINFPKQTNHKTNIEYFASFYEDTYNIIFLKDTDDYILSLVNEIVVIGLNSLLFKYKPTYSSNTIITFDREYHELGRIFTNKLKTYKLLLEKDFDTIFTRFLPDLIIEKAYEVYPSSITYPLVIKHIFGTNGEQVYLVNNKIEWERLLMSNGEKRIPTSDFIVQPFITTSIGSDIRIVCMGNDIFAYERNNPNDFRSNVSLGASFKLKELNDFQLLETKRLMKMIKNNYPDYNHLIGIDIFNDEKFTIIELNSNPGLHGLTSLLDEEFQYKLKKFFNLKCYN